MDADHKYNLIIIGIVGIILIIILIGLIRIKKLNKKYEKVGERAISFHEIFPMILLNFIFCLIFFLMLIVLYAQICIDLRLINDGLLEFNDYLSFLPLKMLEGYDRYTTPIVLFRFLDKFNYSFVIFGAFALSQMVCILVVRLSASNQKDIKNHHMNRIYLFTLGINIILWYIVPFSLIISILLFNIIFGINLKIFRIKIQIHDPSDLENKRLQYGD